MLSNAGLAGRDAFTLYDTYGFPIEITQEVAAERGVVVDMDGFRAAMEEQRSQSQVHKCPCTQVVGSDKRPHVFLPYKSLQTTIELSLGGARRVAIRKPLRIEC